MNLERFNEVIKIYHECAERFQLIIITAFQDSLNARNMVESAMFAIQNIPDAVAKSDDKNNMVIIGRRNEMRQFSEYLLLRFIKQLAENLLKKEDPNADCWQLLRKKDVEEELSKYDFSEFVKIDDVIQVLRKNPYLDGLFTCNDEWWVKEGFYKVITDFENSHINENDIKKFFKYDT